jgi:hypothetical protein
MLQSRRTLDGNTRGRTTSNPGSTWWSKSTKEHSPGGTSAKWIRQAKNFETFEKQI